MSTSKPEAAVDSMALGTTKPSEITSVAWDPYEVWRTRVLRPRLAEEADQKADRLRHVRSVK